ncbi:helix-turn-helix transcriptional regulator [Pseudomonas sp. CFBP 13602]|nr:helix-turn-helix transcriptional regulator [Pseudomonas sp. CFBP 13602]
MRPRKNKASCPVEVTMKIIGGKWKVLILYFLFSGTKRFGELGRCLGPISARTLTQQLRELEIDGIIERKIFEEVPPRVEYTITSLGKSLYPILEAMADWGGHLEHVQPSKELA